jgi:hypothetical protein
MMTKFALEKIRNYGNWHLGKEIGDYDNWHLGKEM